MDIVIYKVGEHYEITIKPLIEFLRKKHQIELYGTPRVDVEFGHDPHNLKDLYKEIKDKDNETAETLKYLINNGRKKGYVIPIETLEVTEIRKYEEKKHITDDSGMTHLREDGEKKPHDIIKKLEITYEGIEVYLKCECACKERMGIKIKQRRRNGKKVLDTKYRPWWVR